MSLTSFEEARPWAAAIRRETAARRMPPWFVERDTGIQGFRGDPSLTDAEIALLGAWVEAGAPRGDGPEPVAPPSHGSEWPLGEPDLVVTSPPITIAAGAADWWGDLGAVPSGLAEDRYVSTIQTREVSDEPGSTIFHHAGFQAISPDGQLQLGSIHEVGRNPEHFDAEAASLIKAGSVVVFNNAHLHAGATTRTAHLRVGFTFLPKGQRPRFTTRGITLGNAELDVRGNTPEQMFEALTTLQQPLKLITFEPHMHAAGSRMCLEAIWGVARETLTCVGFDPRWVRTYSFTPNAAPLLPRGTILRLIGWMDTTPRPRNLYLTDPRNWTGWGSRPVDNMFMSYLTVVPLTGDQLRELVAERLALVASGRADTKGCVPCTLPFALDQGTGR